jgi:ABC-type uncharacterized transport system ATPase subunit
MFLLLLRIYRVAIMKNGQIEDQGNLLDLKSRYQNGYKLIIKLNNSSGDTAPIKNYLKSMLDADLQEEYAVNETVIVLNCHKFSFFSFVNCLSAALRLNEKIMNRCH